MQANNLNMMLFFFLLFAVELSAATQDPSIDIYTAPTGNSFTISPTVEGQETLSITVTCEMLDLGTNTGKWNWTIPEELQQNTGDLENWRSQTVITVGKEESGDIKHTVSCTFNSEVGTFSEEYSFQITALPGFESLESGHQYLPLGDTATVVCPGGYLGNPAEQVEWYLNGTKITLGERHSTENGGLHLVIDSVQFSDGGVYNCAITNAGNSPDIDVVVKPVDHYIAASEGEPTEIRLPFKDAKCERWEIEKEDGSTVEIDAKNERYHLSNDSTLNITNTASEDYTTYRCHLENGALFKISLLYSEFMSVCIEDQHDRQKIQAAVMDMLKDLSCGNDDGDRKCIVKLPEELTYTRNELRGMFASGAVSSSHKAVETLNITLKNHEEYTTGTITFKLRGCKNDFQLRTPPPTSHPPHDHVVDIFVTVIVGAVIVIVIVISTIILSCKRRRGLRRVHDVEAARQTPQAVIQTHTPQAVIQTHTPHLQQLPPSYSPQISVEQRNSITITNQRSNSLPTQQAPHQPHLHTPPPHYNDQQSPLSQLISTQPSTSLPQYHTSPLTHTVHTQPQTTNHA